MFLECLRTVQFIILIWRSLEDGEGALFRVQHLAASALVYEADDGAEFRAQLDLDELIFQHQLLLIDRQVGGGSDGGPRQKFQKVGVVSDARDIPGQESQV